VTIDSVAKGRP